MNKNFCIILAILISTVLSVGFVSCGGDDDNNGSGIVDGVNVNNGKKLTRLEIQPQTSSNTTPDYKLRVMYDSNGRLSNVVWTNGQKYENGKYTNITCLHSSNSGRFNEF